MAKTTYPIALVRSMFVGFAVVASLHAQPMELGNRLELFVDHALIESLENTTLKLGLPQPREVALRFDQPWEMPFAGALSVMKDGDTYRMYYRGASADKEGNYDANNEVTCYAESYDGINWVKPILELHEFQGSRANNIILPTDNPNRVSHNFAPFIDNRSDVPADQRYKGVGGIGGEKGAGLFRMVSADGIHWRLFSEEPVFKGYALDTLNIAFWFPAEQSYVAYIRTWSEGGTPDQPNFAGYRTISRSVSEDFKTWTEPEQVGFGAAPNENLYTIGALPYFRAPHIQIALPFRFRPGINVLTIGEAEALELHAVKGLVDPRHGPSLGKLGTGHALGGVSDAVLMSSRGGAQLERTFMESFIRPGLERSAWTARSNCPAFGLVQTGEYEMSLYLQTGYTSNNYHIRRYSLRLDGFASVNAPFEGGEMVTKPLTFSGEKLVINYSTSSIGHLKVEVQDEVGQPIPGFTLSDADEIVGDAVNRKVTWRGAMDVSALAGMAVRLRFQMKDADLYSVQFQ